MPTQRHKRKPRTIPTVRNAAPVFAALGDDTRLALLQRLSAGSQLSISRLAEGSPLTRQAITKHLRVLQRAGLVCHVRRGRETLFEFQPAPLSNARHALDAISRQWDDTLGRLKAFAEADTPAEH